MSYSKFFYRSRNDYIDRLISFSSGGNIGNVLTIRLNVLRRAVIINTFSNQFYGVKRFLILSRGGKDRFFTTRFMSTFGGSTRRVVLPVVFVWEEKGFSSSVHVDRSSQSYTICPDVMTSF